jgi:hypothetical protein
MSQTPGHVVVSRLQRMDGRPLEMWSFAWTVGPSNSLLLTFFGLADSTDYRYSLLIE